MCKIVSMTVAALITFCFTMVAVAEENTVENSTDKKVEKKVEKKTAKKAKKTGKKTTKKSAEKPVDTAREKLTEKSTENTAEKNVEKTAEKVAVKPLEPSAGKNSENYEVNVEKSVEKKQNETETSSIFMSKIEVDASIGLATEALRGTGTGWMFSAGGGYEVLKIPIIKRSILQVRGDIAYNRWSGGSFGSLEKGSTYTRIPVSAGVRLYAPIETINNLRVYGEASLELSFDKLELDFGSWGKKSYSQTNFGITPAIGAVYAVTPNIFVSGGLKYHVIDGGYLNASLGGGYKF